MLGPEERLRLDQIVLTAASLESTERAAYLHRLTSDHPELLAQARRLLAAASEVSESFLSTPAVEILDEESNASGSVDLPLDAPSAASVPPLTAEERYVMGSLLGSGGMAEVYKAHDRQLDRPVALKLLNDRDSTTLAQCLGEARAQARVRHDNVLEVYETGELEGRPFIALRLVEGTTLADVRDTTSLEQQVHLLMQVAEGLDAAHLTGLVHRDVKPSNVLVEELGDGALKAWVSDFGIASALATTASDAEEHLIGTAPYLAPERLDPSARPDRRGDVWSLGVTMYRLFTGVLPFDDEVVFQLLRKIHDEQPVPPRDLIPTFPPDLEAIVLKCLAKDPVERYPTAHAVAVDLKRFLAGDVVEAHAAGLAYRVTRFAMRHRALVKLAGVAAVLLTISLTAAAVLGVLAMKANQKVVVRQGLAEDLISFMLLDLREKLGPLGRLELLDEVGAKAMQYFAAMPTSELSDEELARHSTALNQIGEVRMRQGNLAAAARAFEESLALADALAERDPQNAERIFDLGQSYFWVGYAERELGNFDQALSFFTSYLELSKKLVAREPGNQKWQLELAYSHSNLGTVLKDRGDLEGARGHYEESLEIRRQLLEAKPENPDLQCDFADSHNALGVVLSALGEPDAARQLFERDLALKKALVEADPRHVGWRDSLGVSYNYLGGWLLRRGFWNEAAEHFRQAVELYENQVVDDPSDVVRQEILAINRTALGRTLVALGALEEGVEQLSQAQVAFEEQPVGGLVSGLRRRELASTHKQLAAAFWRRGDQQKGREHLRKAMEMLEQFTAEILGERDAILKLSESFLLLGDFQKAEGDREGAVVSWRRAAALVEPFVEDRQDHRMQAPWALAHLRLGQGEVIAPLLQEFHAEGFCSPDYEEFCRPDLEPRAKKSF